MSVFEEFKASKKFDKEWMVDAKPQNNPWVKKAKKLGVDGNPVIRDFINYASK